MTTACYYNKPGPKCPCKLCCDQRAAVPKLTPPRAKPKPPPPVPKMPEPSKSRPKARKSRPTSKK